MSQLIGSAFGFVFACIMATAYFCFYLLCTKLRTIVFALGSATLITVLHAFCAMITGLAVGCVYGRLTGEQTFFWMLWITGGLHGLLTLTVVWKFAGECMARKKRDHTFHETQFDLWDTFFYNLSWQIFWPAGYLLRLMDGNEVSFDY